MPSRSNDPHPTVVLTVVPHDPTTVRDDPHPLTGAADTNVPTRCAPGGTSLPVLRPSAVPTDLGVCGGHRVLCVLGRGGTGVIYEAIDVALGRRVALKLMRPELADSEHGRDRFLREARAAASIRHENVVNVYAVGEDDGKPFLSMELLRGDHLAHRMLAGISLPEIVRIGREVALGLAAAHELGVVHRDIKPTNIWIEPTGRVRLLDFGLARSGGGIEGALPSVPTAPGVTEVGALVGTPAFMAPEQLAGGTTDARTDLFSLGAVLYQLVTGRMPFRAATMPELAVAIHTSAYQPIPELAPDTPPALCRLIYRLLSPNPDRRPPSAAEVADELIDIGTNLLVASGSSIVPVPVSREFAPPPAAFEFDDTPPPPRRRSTGLHALLGTLIAVVAMMLVVGVAHRLSKKPPAVVTAPDPPREKPRPTPQLFNGRDLTGWHAGQGTLDSWTVTRGVLAGTRRGNADEILLSDAKYADFELSLEYRWLQQGGHTVVLLRADDATDPISDCLAVNIGDDEGFPDVHKRPIGALYETGLIQGVTFKPPRANRPIGEWNLLSVVAQGPKIAVTLNGVSMPTADLPAKWAGDPKKSGKLRKSGSIGLVCHWGPIDFRNVKVRSLTE